jgi:hypothetical protein
MSHKDLDDFAKKLGWYPTEEEKIIRYKKEFKKQGITDYNTLVAFPSYKLKTTKFGCFRRAKNFFRIILGFVTEVSPDSREKVAKALGWTLSERKKKKRYKEELLKHGIKNYGDLFERNSADLKALKYGDFGSGIQFFSLVLNDSTSKFTREKIERVAEYLGWSCLPYCRKKLAEKRIVDYLSLMNYGKRKFASTDFEEMGTGAMLANKILGLNRESFKRIDDIELEEIADKLGWKLSEDKKKKLMLSLLAEHNLMNYWDLRKISPVEFRNSTFGPIGKGHKFLGFVLGKTVKRITTNVLDELATKLDLMPVLGEKLIRYATELSKNGVTIYEDLVKIQIADFKKMEFGQFGKGAAFIAEVLDIEKGKVTKASMYEVAKKLNLKGVEDQVLYLRNNKTFAKKKGK